MGDFVVGTAGWSIPRAEAHRLPLEGTSLERYAAVFAGAEINSSFHRPHRASTWQRWRESTPAAFRFSVKVPKTITHQKKLVDCDGLLDAFLAEAGLLGDKLAVMLVQLPPKLAFDADVAVPFFAALAARTPASVACEPRHPSWFAEDADTLLRRHRVARVAADPALCAAAAAPGGWPGLRYWRLHGSPVMYRSGYGDRIERYAAELSAAATQPGAVWCIFDNTASSAALGDALALSAQLGPGPGQVERAKGIEPSS